MPTAPYIGSVECDFVKGDIPVAGDEQSLRWHVPGTSGEGILLLGKRGGPFRLTAIKYDTNANIFAWAGQLKALEGTIVTVENDWGNGTTTCFVERVSTPKHVAVSIPGSTATCRGEVQVQCVSTYVG